MLWSRTLIYQLWLTATKRQRSVFKERSSFLFRVVDFYEFYCDDAAIASKVLGITFTRRRSEQFDGRLAGFPYFMLDTYLPKLIHAGYRVAIIDSLKLKEIIGVQPSLPGKELSLFPDGY